MSDQNLKAAMDLIRAKAQVVADAVTSDPRITEIRKLLQSLNTLEELSGESLTPLSAVLRFSSDADGATSAMVMPLTRQDEYYGLEPLEAAKRVLKRLGRSATINEIMDAIRAGGGETGSQDSLQLSLARSTVEIAKIKDGVFGLLEFYPHIRRGKPGRKRRGGDADSTNGEDAASGEPATDSMAEGESMPDDGEKD